MHNLYMHAHIAFQRREHFYTRSPPALHVVFGIRMVASFVVPETPHSYTAANRQVRTYAHPKGYIALTKLATCSKTVS